MDPVRVFGCCSLVAAALALGCGGQGPSEVEDQVDDLEGAVGSKLVPGELTLVDKPDLPAGGCNAITHMSLSNRPSARADLSSSLPPWCPALKSSDDRYYKLKVSDGGCGSSVYTGRYRKKGLWHSVKITDHRARTCMDVLLAPVIVEETRPDSSGNPTTKTLYAAKDAEKPAAPGDITAEGTLTQVAGIGGESTGYAIALDSGGARELLLQDAQRKEFEDGRYARVKGTLNTMRGIEVPVRTIIAVSEMLVCPTEGSSVYCLSGPSAGAPKPYCTADARAWVSAKCEGVRYVDLH